MIHNAIKKTCPTKWDWTCNTYFTSQRGTRNKWIIRDPPSNDFQLSSDYFAPLSLNTIVYQGLTIKFEILIDFTYGL